MATAALVLSRSLHFAKDNYDQFTVSELKSLMLNWLGKHSKPEYFEISDSKTLQPIKNWEDSNSIRAFIATWVGDVRLIDNMKIK